MESLSGIGKPHAVCVPFPAQGHINPMMKFAKLLHFHGFHITFVLTDYNRARLLRSRGPRSLDGTPTFRFVSIPDGLPPAADPDTTQDVVRLCASVERHCEGPFTDLLKSLEDGARPPVTCIVADAAAMSFTLEVANTMGIREFVFWTASACGFLGYEQYPYLVQQGYAPLKDTSDLTNGYLEQPVDWIPSMKGSRLKDIPTFMRTTDPHDFMLNYVQSVFRRFRKLAAGIIFNTFEALELNVLHEIAPIFPPIYTVGPLNRLVQHITPNGETISIGSNLWKEDENCIEWLDSQEPRSVVYVNFGSITVMSNEQLLEFAFGLANSGVPFLWVIRPDLVTGESAVLPPEFVAETRERSLLADWCDQERVLSHPAVGGFLTHSGWNSTLESVSSGVPMICWPFFADQQINCWFSCGEWGVAMEIDAEVKREVVEKQVREMMEGVKREEMRRRAAEWKRLAEAAAAKESGRSWLNLEKLMDHARQSGEPNAYEKGSVF